VASAIASTTSLLSSPAANSSTRRDVVPMDPRPSSRPRPRVTSSLTFDAALLVGNALEDTKQQPASPKKSSPLRTRDSEAFGSSVRELLRWSTHQATQGRDRRGGRQGDAPACTASTTKRRRSLEPEEQSENRRTTSPCVRTMHLDPRPIPPTTPSSATVIARTPAASYRGGQHDGAERHPCGRCDQARCSPRLVVAATITAPAPTRPTCSSSGAAKLRRGGAASLPHL
jgi:hypothetical protein